MLTIDGSYLEGGGQIVRTAVALSAVNGTACKIVNIRQGRRRPGLSPQHVAAIEAVKHCCGARVSGATARSEVVQFEPGPLDPPKRLRLEVGTAGSAMLVLQAALIPLIASGQRSSVEIYGGTHVQWSPVLEYFREIFGWWLGRMGVALRVDSYRTGFYPRGGGHVRVEVGPGDLSSLDCIERGEHRENAAWSIATEDLKHRKVAERQVKGLRQSLELDRVKIQYVDASSTGTAVFAAGCYESSRLGASALGKKGKPAEAVGSDCGRLLREQMDSGACLDGYMADQILPYMALAGETSEVSVASITDHCRTSAWLLEKFPPVRFNVDDSARTIRCMKGKD